MCMGKAVRVDSRLLCLNRAVRACFVDNVGQILRQQFQRLIDRQAEMTREFLYLSVAENGFELIFADWKIGAGPEPGLHLGVEPALLQGGDQAVEIVVLRLREHRVDDGGQCDRLGFAQRPSQHAAETEVIKQTHGRLQHKVEPPAWKKPLDRKPNLIKPDAPEVRGAWPHWISACSPVSRYPKLFC